MSKTASFDLESTLEKFKEQIQFSGPKSKRRTESTAKRYASEVRAFAKYLEEHRPSTDGILDVEISDLRQYLNFRQQQGDKERTVVVRRSALSQFYQNLAIMAEDKVIPLDVADVPVNPEDDFDEIWSVGESEKSSKQGQRSYLKPHEIQLLYQHVPAPEFRNKLIMQMLYQTGMRRKECATLKIDDIMPLENFEVRIRAENAKSGKARTVYFKESLVPVLRRWIDGGYRDSESKALESEYLFPTRESVHIHPNHITKIVKEAAERAGLQGEKPVYVDSGGKKRDKVTAHTLRHSFAVNMLKGPNSIDIRTLQKLLGHSDLSVTEAYLDIVRDDEKQEYHGAGGPPEE